METKERVIDLREYFASLMRHMLIVLIVSVVLAVVLAGYDFYKQKRAASEDTNSATIDKIISQNHDTYYASGTQKTYTDADRPDGTYNSSARLYIDFNYSDVEGSQDMDFSTLNTKFESDAGMLLWSSQVLDKVIEELDLNSYEDMKDFTRDDLMWMVNRNFQGAHVMNIVVTDVDPERGYEICNSILNIFPDVLKKYMNVNEVRILDRPSKAQAQKESEISSSISRKHIAKYGIAGFAAGFILMCIIYLIIFIVRDDVHTGEDLNFAGFKQYGDVIKRSRPEEAALRIAVSLELGEKDSTILLADTDGHYDTHPLVQKINEVSGDGSSVSVKTSDNLLHSSDGLHALKTADAVLITVSYDRTRMKDIETVSRLLDETGRKKLGAIIVK